MTENKFYDLHRTIYKQMKYNIIPPTSSNKKATRNGARNGLIPSMTRLSCAIRYFAGGSPYDIAISHGISVRQVYTSVWRVVDAIHNTPSLDIVFPDYDEQELISRRFKKKSIAKFDGLVGCIDGMLLWMEQPHKADCEVAGVGPKKFFCGRKKKFGLNMTATVDDQRRFIDIDISHPGATSDYLAFSVSSLKRKLESGLLLAGTYIFGDNAYVNTSYMATPYRTPNTAKDNYNFYHSQLRINVECAFGMLVCRWSILRRPLPAAMGIHKITALTFSLCKLHNFLLDDKEDIAPRTSQDAAYGACRGNIELERHRVFTEEVVPAALLRGSDHLDNVDRNTRRQDIRARNLRLPREVLFDSVQRQGLVRPTPKTW